MANEFFTILTAVGRNKLANAVATSTPLVLTQMAVGDGDNGAYYNPTEAQAALKHEVWRGAINHLYVDPNNANWIVAELVIPDNVGGWYIREVGLFDNTGAMIAVGKFPESYKPTLAAGSNKQLYVRMISEVTNTSAVTLVVDPDVVMANRRYVDDKVASELARLDGKQSVRVATTAAIAKYGLPTIDGVALAAGDRVLVKDQAAAQAENGIYVAAAGIWSRAADADQALEVTPGMLVPVEEGAANGDSLWQLATNGTITIGTTGLAFELVSGKTGVTAGTYRSVTVNTRGQITGGTNPTTLSGYGITDALPRFTAGQALPTTNIGPIWHDDYNSLMTWQAFTANGANYTGYASVLVGNLLTDTQPTPRAGYVRSGASNLSRTTYAALRAWAMHNGILVAAATWAAGTIAIKDNADGTTFTAYDVRGEFPRFWDDGRGVDNGRSFGTWQSGSPVVHDDVGGTASFNITALGDGTNVPWANIADPWTGAFPLTMYDASAATFVDANNKGFISMSRPRNVAFLPAIKY
ncbi:phage tail protein [Ralstonia solanacearum]|uniref:phage tail protein n=1 Tax=Ralstonia solanacearum TaxID=305 RepID=UPI0001D94DCD|nr:phage tail protein [Ralstonia solanacearum]CBJ43028.1 putative tail fiber-related protein [Ralstonia solanacearum CFBP2957]